MTNEDKANICWWNVDHNWLWFEAKLLHNSWELGLKVNTILWLFQKNAENSNTDPMRANEALTYEVYWMEQGNQTALLVCVSGKIQWT